MKMWVMTVFRCVLHRSPLPCHLAGHGFMAVEQAGFCQETRSGVDGRHLRRRICKAMDRI